jgi:branched-chain amino acid transport system permease protein
MDEGLGDVRDRESDVRAVFDAHLRARLTELVTPSLLEEHRRNPVGHHSPALGVVLTALRQVPTRGKLALLAIEPGRQWMIIRLSGEQGVDHDLSDPARYSNENDALHEVFLRRLGEAGIHETERTAP